MDERRNGWDENRMWVRKSIEQLQVTNETQNRTLQLILTQLEIYKVKIGWIVGLSAFLITVALNAVFWLARVVTAGGG